MNTQTSIWNGLYQENWKIDYFHPHCTWLQCPGSVWPLMLRHFWSSQHSPGVTLRHPVHVLSTTYATISLKCRWIFTNIMRTNSSLSTCGPSLITMTSLRRNNNVPWPWNIESITNILLDHYVIGRDMHTNLPSLFTWHLDGSKLKSHPLLRYDWSAVWIGPILLEQSVCTMQF